MQDPPGMRDVNKRLQRSARKVILQIFFALAGEEKMFFEKRYATAG